MLSCFGIRRGSDADREPLLPQYNDDTSRQNVLHQKLHSYQMFRALGRGYMPSNEQVVANLRSLLATDLLNPDNPSLSDSGRLLVKHVKEWLKAFITILMHKNRNDEFQELVWQSIHARVSVDTKDIAQRVGKAKARADAAAVYRSVQTVGSLFLSNADFRLFLSDLTTVGRQVFQDTASALSGVAEETGQRLAPSDDAVAALQAPGSDAPNDENGRVSPSADDLGSQVTEVSQVFAQGATKVLNEARESAADKFSGREKDTLLFRLKQAVLRLRKRPDYDGAVSTLSLLFKRWAMVYSRALKDSASTLQDDVHENAEADRAVKNAWSLLSSFGEKKEWDQLEKAFHRVLSHKENDPEFEELITELGTSFERLLTDPDFLDNADKKLEELRQKTKKVGTESDLREDCDALLAQGQKTLHSVLNDQDVAELIHASSQISGLLAPSGGYITSGLLHDFVNVYAPLMIDLIQVVPIPRLEVSTPELDLLLENLILTPGHTVNKSSFLPYLFGLTTQNDIVVRKTHTSQISSSLGTKLNFKLNGFSVKAEDIGFWLRLHKGLLRFTQSGLASFAVDERGVDIQVDVSIQQRSLERVIALDAVKVQIHKLNYNLRSNAFSFFAWVFKPLLRPILRKVIERQMALAIADLLRAANREVVFARERLRATRISEPKDLITFFKAVMARLTPEEDPDLYTRVGVDQPGYGVFKGRYAPGSLTKLWVDEGQRAGERIEDGVEVIGGGREGWRNDIFDLRAA